MEDTQSGSVLIDSAASKIQQLQQAFAELERHRAVTLNLKWKELEAHFHGLEKSLKRRFDELEDQEKVFESKTSVAKDMLEKRQAAVRAKEEGSLERLQEKRDAAVFAIVSAREKQRKVSSPHRSVVISGDCSPASSMNEKPSYSSISERSTIEDMGSPSQTEVQSAEYYDAEVLSNPQLVKLCQEMDAEGLHNFISDNRKNLATIREEIPLALKAAVDPARLVLDSLDNFYRGDATNLDAKKDSALLGIRRSCIMLMECLSTLFASLDAISVSNIISEDVKARAKVIADGWKPRLCELDLDANNGNSLEAHAFLQLLASFTIASDFDEEELSKLIPMVSRRRQAAELCRSLGLSEKMPGVIDVLIKSGRQIDAVNLTFAFELTEQFPPLPLLKSYLKEARKPSSPVKSGNASPQSPNVQNEVNDRELFGLKAVIKCVEEHKLEVQLPIDSLQKRVLLLEKAKADKQRATEVTKPQPKRPRANNSGCVPRIANIVADRSPPYPRPADRYPQYMFDRPYVYAAPPSDNHCTHLFGAAPYGLPPGHGNYFGNGYQYQASPYLH